ncbi:MAG: biotin synthase BioB [candidate division NC10 bacterium]|nr:biotin synthase BioB [candidate division NC10 bacterium]
MDYHKLAEKSLRGEVLTRQEMGSVLGAPAGEISSLLNAALRVRQHFWGRKVHLHMLTNARSGLCPEDCHYCSQSAISQAPIAKYPLLSRETLLEGAQRAKAARAVRYCIVTSGRGPTDRDIETLAAIVRDIRQAVEINICCSLGLMTEGQARTLKGAGVERVNHNLNTSRRFHPAICSTHTYDDRVRTVENVRRAGLSTCCGGIVGMGETDDDLMDLALSLRELDVASIPVNFLHPIPGTPFEGYRELTPERCLKVLCLFRFVNPAKEIRVAGGRELNLGSQQALAMYPANSLFVDGYLTTPGQAAADTHRMIEAHGFEIDDTVPPSA